MLDVMTPQQRRKLREERQIDAEKYPNLAQFAKPLDYPVREIVGRDDERTQILSNLCRPELSNVMLLAPPGSGKALANDTLIPVADRRIYVPISELEVGDGVYNGEGKKVVISGVFPQGKKSAWKVVPQYGEPVVCNDEHIWTVYDHAMDIQRTCTLGELLDMGMRYGNDEKLRFSVPIAESVERSGTYEYKTRAIRTSRAEFMVKEFISEPENIIKLSVADRQACIDALPEKFSITPRGRDTVVVHTGVAENALWVMRLLCTTGYAARIDRDSTCVEWAISTPKWQYIDAVALGEEVDMTCIKVDSADGLFQAGRSHIVTHNTALTQSVMLVDPEREYFEIDPARLINDLANPNEMGARLKSLFDEAELYASREGNELVLFIDEFHQIVQLSEAAVEALKPVLADSGSRGLRFIAATTYDEYNKYIRPNAPLDERLQRITLTPTGDKQTVEILRNTAKKYGVADQFFDDGLFEQIVEITNRYQPSSVQPRKSIRVLDSMIGRHRFTGAPMDMTMLMSVISDSTGMNLAFNINGSKIKEQLDANVYSQQLATTVVARRLQLVVADLHDKSRPQGSFLFAGATGTGKTELTKQIARLMFGDDRNRLIRFDMSEFARKESMETFRDELTSQVVNQGHAVVLLDEVEKADRAILRLLLQVLDDGRLNDRNGRQVSFLNTYIVMTTNAGSGVFKDIGQYEASDTGDGRNLDDWLVLIESAIRDTGFPPELLGRIDELVPFQPLSRATQQKVVTKALKRLRDDVKSKHNITMMVKSDVLTYITEDLATTDTDRGGARGAIRILNKEIATAVAKFINENPEYSKIQIGMEGQLRAHNKHIRKSQAHPVIRALKS